MKSPNHSFTNFIRIKMFNGLVVLSLVTLVFGQYDVYKGYQMYKVELKTKEQQNNLDILKDDVIDFLRKPSQKHGVIGQAIVPPTHTAWFEDRLEVLGVDKEVIIEDIEKYLTESKLSSNNTVFDFKGYYRYDTILDHMRSIVNTHQNSTNIDIKLIDAGKTNEDRPLVYLKLVKPTRTGKAVVVIEAGMNPREWITVPAALNIVNEVIERKSLLDYFDWIIIPVVNPDGYEFTHTNLRFWTKNRSTSSNLGIFCPGVNINRNFDIDWSASDSSTSPCSHLYAGTEPFSEAESKFIRSIHQEYRHRIRLYISLQNSGGFIAYPWQYEKAATGMFRQHYLLGLKMREAMDNNYNLDAAALAYGTRASGTSTDYMTLNGILYGFNLDVEQKGTNGVEVPVSDIKTVVDKVWRGIEVAVQILSN